jgi:hypothetical protein
VLALLPQVLPLLETLLPAKHKKKAPDAYLQKL